MSAVKRKLKNKSLKEQHEIIRHNEKSMANKKASEKLRMPKNTTSTLMQNKDKLLSSLQETSSSTKKVVAIRKR